MNRTTDSSNTAVKNYQIKNLHRHKIGAKNYMTKGYSYRTYGNLIIADEKQNNISTYVCNY